MRTTRIILIWLAATMGFCIGATLAYATNYYAAPTGADDNPGTLDRPFATLRRAQQAVRQARGREPVTVFLRAGIHYLPETLVFAAADSGTQVAPVIYRAYGNEQVVVSGGVRLTNLKWE